MYGDPSAIRALAHGLRTRAEDVRREADRLVARLDSTPWTGRAADAARGRGRERAGDLMRTAALHETAADAVDRHAREVEHRRDLIAHVERVVTGLVADAVAAGTTLVLPAAGSRDWLDVDVSQVAATLGRAA